jgi:hypothetical protein
MILEDGTGVPGANSYATEDAADDYFDDRANTDWATSTADKEAALIRASAAIDARYWSQFSGDRLMGRDQGLEWPRANATDIDGNPLPSDELPIELVQATFEMAVRELLNPGSGAPDLTRAVRSVHAGSVSVDFAANALPTTQFTIIDGILSRLIGGAGASARLFGASARG